MQGRRTPKTRGTRAGEPDLDSTSTLDTEFVSVYNYLGFCVFGDMKILDVAAAWGWTARGLYAGFFTGMSGDEIG